MADYEKVVQQAQENDERIAQLRKQGAQLDPVSTMAARMELFINAVLGPPVEGNHERLAFESDWNDQMVVALNNLDKQLRKSRLQRLRP